VAGAEVGSLAMSEGDLWSDLDLTFGVAEGTPITEVLEDWTHSLVEELDAVHLFDLPSGASIYRVFLLPDCLQFDLSFTPICLFGARGPKFKLLFGIAIELPLTQPPPAAELFGYAVHHLLRARFCIERHRYWQAEYWISAGRVYALSLACRRLSLPVAQGRGYDELPEDVRYHFKDILVTSLQREELMRALASVIEATLYEAGEVRETANKVAPRLHQLIEE